MRNIKIDIINLAHREDRKNQSIQSMTKIKDLIIAKENFFEACNMPDNGALGCAISHFSVISDFIKQPQYEYQLVFEDDIEFRQEFELNSIFNVMNQFSPTFDAFLFAHNTALFTEVLYSNYQRVINAQTTSGYLITRKFAPKLLECFAMAINFMNKFSNPEQRPLINSLFAIDVLWKQLQLENIFITTDPAYGFQRAGYSDVEKKDVDYGV